MRAAIKARQGKYMSVGTVHRVRSDQFRAATHQLPTDGHMAKRKLWINEVEQAITDGQPIIVLAGSLIWSYHKIGEGWVRVRTELSSPEAAERQLVAYADEGCLILDPTANGNATAVLERFDDILHARVSPVKSGFILCGDEDNQEPAIAVCAHVLQAAVPSFYKEPVPNEGEYGQAYCAACAAKTGTGHLRMICYTCYLWGQNSVVVTDSLVVIANDGNCADLARAGDGAPFHFHRDDTMSAEEFLTKFHVGAVIEAKRMVEKAGAAA